MCSSDLAEFGDKSKEELIELQHVVSIAGRILAKRGPFMSIQDMKGASHAARERWIRRRPGQPHRG